MSAYVVLKEDDNQARLKAAVEEILKVEDPMMQMMAKMQTLLPMVAGMVKPEMEKYGFDDSNFMVGLMQIKQACEDDEETKPMVDELMEALKGNFSA